MKSVPGEGKVSGSRAEPLDGWPATEAIMSAGKVSGSRAERLDGWPATESDHVGRQKSAAGDRGDHVGRQKSAAGGVERLDSEPATEGDHVRRPVEVHGPAGVRGHRDQHVGRVARHPISGDERGHRVE